MIDATYLKAIAQIDSLRSLLRDCLALLSPETVSGMIEQFQNEMQQCEDVGDKLYAHAALVGVLTTMQTTIEAEASDE